MPEIALDGTEFSSLADQVLEGGNILRFRARGDSMAPCIRDGDWLEIRRAEAPSIRSGDVLLCRSDHDRLLAHRVIHVDHKSRQPSFLLQGDSRVNADGFFSLAQVIGRVEAIERRGRRLDIHSPSYRLNVKFWTTPIGRRLSRATLYARPRLTQVVNQLQAFRRKSSG